MTGQPTAADLAQQLATGLVQMGQALEPILEAVEGYRVRLEAAGYGDALARRMAADYHAALLRMLLK